MSDTLRTRIIRLAHSRPDLRPHLLPLVSDRAACGWGGEAPVTARFEEGVSADPTENMSPEDAAEWKKQNAIHRDKFTKGASGDIGASLAKMRNDSSVSFSNAANTVFVHVWFDTGVARYDRGGVAPDSGEWEVIVSTSSDRLNLNPRGQELGRKTFRYVEAASRPLVLNAAEEYIVTMLSRYRMAFTKGASGTGRTAATLRMISDPGHGWLEVPVSDLIRLGISRKISQYSFRKGQMAYLEEDMDAGTYLEALDAAGEPRPDIVEVYQERTPIRNYPRYKGASGAGRTAGVIVDHNSIRRTYAPGVYDTWLLTDRARNGKKPQAAARQVLSQYRTQLSQMTAGDAVTFVDRKVMEMTGKVPDWHYYSMPD